MSDNYTKGVTCRLRQYDFEAWWDLDGIPDDVTPRLDLYGTLKGWPQAGRKFKFIWYSQEEGMCITQIQVKEVRAMLGSSVSFMSKKWMYIIDVDPQAEEPNERD